MRKAIFQNDFHATALRNKEQSAKHVSARLKIVRLLSSANHIEKLIENFLVPKKLIYHRLKVVPYRRKTNEGVKSTRKRDTSRLSSASRVGSCILLACLSLHEISDHWQGNFPCLLPQAIISGCWGFRFKWNVLPTRTIN